MQKNETITTEKSCRECGKTYAAQMTSILGRFPTPVKAFKTEPGTCSECRETQQKALAATFRRRMLGFDHDSIAEHFKANPPQAGQPLILAMFQHNMSNYRLVRVAKADHGRQRRIIIEQGEAWGGASYYRNGKSCFHPKGQAVLLPYVEAVAKRLSFERETTLSDDELRELFRAE